MTKNKNNRNKWLHVRLSEDEYTTIHKAFSTTLDSKISVYIRKIILGKPHIGRYRNQSQDDLITELGKLRMELNAAGNNLNQAVKKLHTLSDVKDIKGWLLTWELDKKNFYSTVENVNRCIAKIADQWLQ